MPADPTTNLGASRLPTETDDIGHIAPSYETPKRFNTLAIRPQYRISLRMGEIEKIFDTKPDTKEGRMARLQVLGLFYWPLNHRVAAGKLPPNTPGYEAKVKPLRAHATAARDKANAFRSKANALDAKHNEMFNAWNEYANAADGTPAKAGKLNLLRNKLNQLQTASTAAMNAATAFQTAAGTFKTNASTTELKSWGDWLKDEKADNYVVRATDTNTKIGTLVASISDADYPPAGTAIGLTVDDGANAASSAQNALEEVNRAITAANHSDVRQNPDGSAYNDAWDYFKKTFCTASPGPAVSDADADKEIQKRLKEWVVQKFDGTEANCAYTIGSATPGGSELPISPDEGETPAENKGHYAKIRLPGGYGLLSPLSPRYNSNNDPRPGTPAMGLLDNPFETENSVLAANVALHKIPLIAKVEVWRPADGKWHPAGKDVQVGFKLIKPFKLPDFAAGRDFNKQLNRAPLRESAWSVTNPPVSRNTGTGPRYFTKVLEEHDWNDGNKDDPQRGNAFHSFGGKREGGIDDVIFAVGQVKGIHAAHSPPSATIGGGPPRVFPMSHKFFPLSESFGDATVQGVKTKTNADGEACAVFLPSRCAGDSYRFRAFVIDPSMDEEAKKGEGKLAVRVDTGTLVIWRNIRFSRLATLRLPAPAALKASMVAAAKIQADDVGSGATDAQRWMWDYMAVKAGETTGRGLATIEFTKAITRGLKGDPFDALTTNFARAYCEFERDPGYDRSITQQEWDDACKIAIEDANEIGVPKLNISFDINSLFFRDGAGSATDGMDVNTGFLMPARTPTQYDAAAGAVIFKATNPGEADAVKANMRKVSSLLSNYLLSGAIRSLTRNGHLPGMTIVHCVMFTNLSSEHRDFGINYSGMAMDYNAAFNFYGIEDQWPEKIGDDVWFGYGYTANVLHEIGHILYLQHDGGLHGGDPAGGPSPQFHDNAGYIVDTAVDEPPHGTCIMSYRASEGQFCAKCNSRLRGWNVKGSGALQTQMPAPPPEPAPAPDPGPTPPPPKKKGLFDRLFGRS